MHEKTLTRVVGFFVLILAVGTVVAVQAIRNINRSIATSDWVNHTHAVISETEALRAELHAADGALQAFVLTGNARDASACREALGKVEEHLEVGRALTRNDPAQSAPFAELDRLAKQRAARAVAVMAARQSGNAEGWRLALRQDAGGEGRREIERKIHRIKSDQMALLADRDRAAYRQAQATRWTVWSGLALDVLLLGIAGWLVRDDIAARRRAAALLEHANERLEAGVRERTAELAGANAQLATENLERQWSNHALEHQLRYNQLIVDSINDLVFVVTKAMNVSRVNPAVVHLTGLEPIELINRPLSRIVRLREPDAGERMFDPVVQALREGRDLRNCPAVVTDKRGRETLAGFTLFPLRDGDKIVGGVVTLHLGSSIPPSGSGPHHPTSDAVP